MCDFVVLATGPSMSQALADYVRGKCRVVAVSDAYRLAPWADALVSHDAAWWQHHKEAMRFAGRKYCGVSLHGTLRVPQHVDYRGGPSSGLQAMRVAEILGAKRILLLGFDMHGSHFFGPHPEPLRNTSDARFAVHVKQFRKWRGCEVINCTPGSSLKQFRFADIQQVVEAHQHAGAA